MDEQLNQALTDFVSMVSNAAEKAGQFGAEQMPDVIEQLLLWELTLRSLSASLFLVISIFSVVIIKRIWSSRGKEKDVYWESYKPEEPTLLGLTCLTFVSGAFIFFSISATLDFMAAVKVVVAPKIFLIEYAAGLVK